MAFFEDETCSLVYYTTRTDAKSLAFEKVGVSENVTAVMIYERASATVEHSTECSDLYLSS
ncbi:hypothetical protein PF006_g14966 [Phytophthora fragariae]|uniref:Uncharacterized protein n=1 Tax=Phytophthora fragariae TaxID=53985 RepID=A0A6A3FNV6_9STRA|nr:hypothetical protein PF003_g30354 [Phytophthora fragariae]KAE8947744.1 hypothetical protein PF009_g2650 [Phytophthora fragariae]KAE9133769.1 hypothetical protein PF006_g14966 [Phytophthora fragariae]KAE9251084.1 hypothetical protein PF004_g2655 [Phytophthora fragariae]KAE9322875.1 hypothetical protein PF008_g17491 [Phytophthora fragariae]